MNAQPVRIATPFTDDVLESLHTGDEVLISGVIYTARDAAHKRIAALLSEGGRPPFELAGQVIYYAGPAPPKPGRPIGSVGPTTSGRMDPYAPLLMEHGLKGMIGKGSRSEQVKDAIRRFRAVYFAAIGGTGAMLSRCVLSSRVVAYDDLGPEAVRRLEVVDFPAFVVNDVYGGDLYEEGVARYRTLT